MLQMLPGPFSLKRSLLFAIYQVQLIFSLSTSMGSQLLIVSSSCMILDVSVVFLNEKHPFHCQFRTTCFTILTSFCVLVNSS